MKNPNDNRPLDGRLQQLLGKPSFSDAEAQACSADDAHTAPPGSDASPKAKLAAPQVESMEYESVISMASGYIEALYAELPDTLREHIDAALYPCPDYWDSYTRKERERQLDEYDLKHNPARQVESAAGWWDWSMDASAWWSAESISPTNAAMLLSGHNPNKESLKSAKTSSSDEMVPADFRRLQNTFDGASDSMKTLERWIAYARERGLKIHSWIQAWESWIVEVRGRSMFALVEPAEALPGIAAVTTKKALRVLESEGPGTTHRITSRTRLLDIEIARAKSTAGTTDHHAVWTELIEMALQETAPFTGEVSGKGIAYNKDGVVVNFTKDALRQRLKKQVDSGR